VQDLDSLPWPDREIFNAFTRLHLKNMRYFMAGRGCPYDCTFCFNHVARKLADGQYVRWRSVEDLIRELKLVKERYGMRFVNFQDDTFVLDLSWLESFCKHYRQEIDLPFFCHVRADLVTDRVSEMLSNAGCVHLAMGLESGNDYIRNVVLNKRISREQFFRACHSLRSHDILFSTHNIFGLPYETINAALETIELNIHCRPDRVNVVFFVPYPGTQLTQIAIDEEFLESEDVNFLPEGFTSVFSSINLKLGDVQQIERLAWLTRLCVRFPIIYPLLRFVFNCKMDGIKTLVTLILLFLKKLYISYARDSVRFTREPIHLLLPY
jgi:radical SAM superfamily enzyme YgiQ (UPF0313 family)